MKKYAIILLLLLLIGLGLSVRLLTQDQRLDATVFLSTTESIRNLQALEQNLALALNQSRYNSDFDPQQLGDTHYEISEEFDNLRFDALFEEIEASAGLSEAVAKFEQQFASREEILDGYMTSNQDISNALSAISKNTQLLLKQTNAQESAALLGLLGSTNALVYQLGLESALTGENEQAIEDAARLLAQFQHDSLSEEIQEALTAYKAAVSTLFNIDSINRGQFSQLNLLGTAPLMDSIEGEYTRYHNKGITGSNQFRNALIIYGLCLLAALAFFAWRIRRSYLSLEQEVADRTAEIKTAYDELQESQEQLIQSEKMASLGQMVAGVAHEINTPLGYVSSNVGSIKLNLDDISGLISGFEKILEEAKSPIQDKQKISKQLSATLRNFQKIQAPDLLSESKQLLSDGEYGLSEISKLVSSLKDFARLDRQESELVDINDCLENSLTIASNSIRENQVDVLKKFEKMPLLACFPSKLNQLFLNIITNACQAMSENGGQLEVSSVVTGNNVVVEFRDQGIGMDDSTQQQMFDPFFTTKEIGEGTGLGMSIAYKIVQAHAGEIDVQSELGIGSVVRITLPLERQSSSIHTLEIT